MSGEVLVLQHSPTDPPGLLGEVLRDRGIPARVVRADLEPLPAGDGWAAAVVLGGPQSVAAPPPWLSAELDLVGELVGAGVPTLGMCLGGQLLAAAFGAPVRPAGTRYGFGEVPLNPAGRADPLFAGLPDRLLTFSWNGEQFELPPGAVRLDAGDGETAAFRVGPAGYGVQFHWELTPEMLLCWQQKAARAEPGEVPVAAGLLSRVEELAPARYPLYRKHAEAVFANLLDLAG